MPVIVAGRMVIGRLICAVVAAAQLFRQHIEYGKGCGFHGRTFPTVVHARRVPVFVGALIVCSMRAISDVHSRSGDGTERENGTTDVETAFERGVFPLIFYTWRRTGFKTYPSTRSAKHLCVCVWLLIVWCLWGIAITFI